MPHRVWETMGRVREIPRTEIGDWLIGQGYLFRELVENSSAYLMTFDLAELTIVHALMDESTIERLPGWPFDGYRIFLCDRGGLTVKAVGRATELVPGHAVMVEADTIESLGSRPDSLHWAFWLRGSAALRARLVAGDPTPVMRIESPYLHALVRMARAMVADRLAGRNSHDAYVEQVTVSAAMAAIRHQRAAFTTGDPDPLDLSVMAALIEEHAADPEFTVQCLAELLDVPPRQLQRAFVRRGSTPSQALRLARIANARRLLATASSLPRDDLARAAGFSSHRAMLQAMKTQHATDGEHSPIFYQGLGVKTPVERFRPVQGGWG